MKPTIGRIVHYHRLADNGELRARAAIISDLRGDGGTVALNIFEMGNLVFRSYVPYSEEPAHNRWSWPVGSQPTGGTPPRAETHLSDLDASPGIPAWRALLHRPGGSVMGDMAELAEDYAMDEWGDLSEVATTSGYSSVDWDTFQGLRAPSYGESLKGIVRKIVREELDKRQPVITWPSMPVPYYPPPAYPPIYPTYPTWEWASPLTFGGGTATTTTSVRQP